MKSFSPKVYKPDLYREYFSNEGIHWRKRRMHLYYECRHCRAELGRIQSESVDLDKLGWHYMTEEERQNILLAGSNDPVKITCICEYCQALLEENPDYFASNHIIH